LALPAVSFKYLPYIHWSKELIFPAIGPLVVWFGAWVFIKLYATKSKHNKLTQGGITLTAGLSNTSFIGFPLITAYFGEKFIGIGVICDQVTFTILSTLGVFVAINSSKKQALNFGVILKKILRFPPFLGCVSALIIPHFIDISPINPLVEKLAACVGPMALFSIGLQLKFTGWKTEAKNLSATLFYKLLIAPTLVLLLALLLKLKGAVAQITIFEASMATLLTSGMVADEYNLNPALSNLVIGVGIVISFITTFFWWWILKFIYG
jgi:predicted permease